jgi:hypothetical protein
MELFSPGTVPVTDCAEAVEDGKTEINGGIQTQKVAGNTPGPVNFFMMAVVGCWLSKHFNLLKYCKAIS